MVEKDFVMGSRENPSLEIFEENIAGDDGKSYKSYGARAVLGDEVLESVSHITTEKEKIQLFVSALEAENASYIHLRELAEDFVQDEEKFLNQIIEE